MLRQLDNAYAYGINVPEVVRTVLTLSCVLYNSDLRQLKDLLDSVDVALKKAGIKAQFDLIDNSHCPKYTTLLNSFILGKNWPNIERLVLLTGHGNLGYGKGNNKSIEQVWSDYHLVINPDVMLDEDVLKVGIDYLRSHRDTVMVVPNTLDPTSGETEYLAKTYPSVFVLALRFLGVQSKEGFLSKKLSNYEYRKLVESEEPFSPALASGCFMLCRTDVLKRVGGFDPSYFLYFEDFDLSIKMRKQGKIAYLPDMKILHHGGGAGRKGMKHIRLFIAAAFKFFNRHGWKWF
jgi:GT2 family glycosyltransferase